MEIVNKLRWLAVVMWTLGWGQVSAQSVLFISVDGLPPDYVLEADRLGLQIPNLRRYVTDGSYAQGVVGVLPTVTYPSHTTMMTGVHPTTHGIISNTPFDPLLVNRDGWYWYAEDIRVTTLWQIAQQAGLSTAAVNWPVTVGDTAIDYLLPEFWRASTPDDMKLIGALSRPEGLYAALETRVGSFVDGNVDTVASDLIRVAHARAIMELHKPRFIAVHLIALDGEEHRQGPYMPPVMETLEAIDTMIGELEQVAQSNDPNTVLVVASDHGFIATHTAVNLRSAFVEAGLITLSAQSSATVTVTDWRAQLWSSGASAAVMLREPGDEDARAAVLALLQRLQADPANGIARILEPEAMRLMGGFPDAVFGIDFQPGFYLGAALQGPMIEPATSRGTHGYTPDRPEMQAAFFIRGPGIASGRDLGVVDMRALAPTLARSLGLAFPSSDLPAMDVFEE